MKTKPLALFALLLLLAVGFALLKRNANHGSASQNASSDGRVTRASDRDGGPPQAGRTKRERSPEAEEELSEIEKQATIEREKTFAMWLGSASSAFGQTERNLIADFGLNAGQADALEEIFARRKERLAALFANMHSDEPKDDRALFKDICALIRNKGLRDELAGVLSKEQLQAYDAREQRREKDSAEAKAYKDMAEISSVVRLKESQKQELLGILKTQAPFRLEEEADARAFMSLQFGAIATEMDSFVIQGLSNMMNAAGVNSSMDYGDAEHQKWIEKQRAERIENELSAVHGVLDEDQLTRYREHLEKQPPL